SKVEQIASVIRGLGLVPECVSECSLADGPRDVRLLRCPISETGPKSVAGRDAAAKPHAPQRHQERHVRERSFRGAARKHVFPAIRGRLCTFEDLDCSRGQRYTMINASLHADAEN